MIDLEADFQKTIKPSQHVIEELHAMAEKKGLIAAIEPESGKYFFGKTVIEAGKEAKSFFPDSVFYFIRIGSKYVYRR